jgi:hypothetical protein
MLGRNILRVSLFLATLVIGSILCGQNQTPPNPPPPLQSAPKQPQEEGAKITRSLITELNLEGQRNKEPYQVQGSGDNCQIRIKAVVNTAKEFNSIVDPFDWRKKTTANVEEGFLNLAAIDPAGINASAMQVTVQGRSNQEIFAGNVVYIDKVGKGNLLDLEVSCTDGHHPNGHKCQLNPANVSTYAFAIPDGPQKANEIADDLTRAARACGGDAANVAPPAP